MLRTESQIKITSNKSTSRLRFPQQQELEIEHITRSEINYKIKLLTRGKVS